MNGWLQNMESATSIGAALIASVCALVSAAVTVSVWWRTRPNRTRETVDAALQPVHSRLQALTREVEQVMERQQVDGVSIKAIDSVIGGRLQEIEDKVDRQGGELTRIATSLEHMAESDQSRTLHHRVTDVAKAVAGLAAASEQQGKQLQMIQQHLLDQARRSDR